MISDFEKDYIIEGIEENLRNDGRENDSVRDCKIKLSAIPQSFGSSIIEFGEENTQIMISIRVKH
jgi:exosome complex RNA-binding protein Rrp42 (RNase PH superfamily)